MNMPLENLDKWYDQILDYISYSELKNLSEYTLPNGENPFIKFTDITRSKESLKDFSFSDFKHGDEFNFISMDLIYVIAIIELLHPYINNVVHENGTYLMTREDHLYLRYAGFGLQTIYLFWDRIGDILALFFQTGMHGDVYLSRVFNNFPNSFRSDTYVELLILYNSQVEPVITDRHGVVHTFGLKSKFYYSVMAEDTDEGRRKIQREKDSYPDLFRRQLNNFFEGFTLAMKLISELPDKKHFEVTYANVSV